MFRLNSGGIRICRGIFQLLPSMKTHTSTSTDPMYGSARLGIGMGACLGVSETEQVLIETGALHDVAGDLLGVSNTLDLGGAQDLVAIDVVWSRYNDWVAELF